MRGVGLLLSCLLSATALAAGTPFFSSERGFEFHDRSITGVATDRGLLLGFPHGDRIRWGIDATTRWEVEPQGVIEGSLQDLRFGVHRAAVPLFSSVAVSFGFSGMRLSLRRGADSLKSQLEVVGSAHVGFFYEGARDVAIAEDGAALVVTLEQGLLHERELRCSERSAFAEAPVPCRFADVRRGSDGRFEYRIVAERRDLSAVLVIDPTFVWTDTFGGIWREYYPFIARASPTSDALVFMSETTSGLEGWTPTGSYGTPLTDGGPNTFDNRSDFILGERAGADAGEAVTFILVGGDGSDGLRAFVHGVPPLPASCAAGVTTSSLTSLAGINSIVRTTGPVNDGGTGNGFIWCRHPTSMPSQYAVFGGSGVDEALGFFPIASTNGLHFVIVGRTSSTNLPFTCPGTACASPSALSAGFLGRVDFVNPSLSQFALHPRDGREGRITAVVPKGDRFYTAGLYPSASDDAGFVEIAYFFSVADTPAHREVIQSPRFFPFVTPMMAMTADAGHLYVTGATYGPVTAGVTIDGHHSGSSPVDGYVTRLSLSDTQIRSVWTTHLGGNLGEVPLALTATKEGDAIVGGYTTSPTNDTAWFPIGRSTLTSFNDGGTRMFLSQLADDGQPRYRHFFGGPFGQDQLRTFLYLPNGFAPAVDKLWIGLGLQSTFSADAGALPGAPANTPMTSERENGFSLVAIDTRVPQIQITPDSPVGEAAAFSYTASNSGPSGLRWVTARLDSLDAGAQFVTTTTFLDGGSPFSSRFVYTGGLAFGGWRATVTAMSDDGFSATATSDFSTFDQPPVVTPDAGQDAGTVEPVDSGTTPPDGPRGVSPIGFSCSAADGSLLLMALVLAARLGSRRPSRRF